MMQIQFNFNNFIFYGVSATAWQRASGKRHRRCRLWLADAVLLCSLIACVANLRWMETQYQLISDYSISRLLRL